MSRIIVLGGAVCGLAAGLVLARDGHDVTLLERDPAPVPESALAAWEAWSRGGVPHFKQAHGLQPLGVQILDRELPDVAEALVAAGATRANALRFMPPAIRDERPGDERFEVLHVRRPVLEQVVARAAEAQPGLTVRRGTAAVALLSRGMNGSARVCGVRTESGEELYADLVVDAMGRGSRLPRLLADAGLAPPDERVEGSRFVYYTRYFRGAEPEARAPRLTAIGSFSILTLNGDNGTWSISMYAAAGDRALKRLRDPATFTKVVRACPRHAHWLDGEPITGVMPMGGVSDRRRDAAPATPGVVSVADAWACTNPTLGRGIAIGLRHVALLRAVVRERLDDPRALAAEWRARTDAELGHFYEACLASDRARLAEMQAYAAGREPARPTGPAAVMAAIFAAMPRDAAAFRAGLEIISCLAPSHEVVARPGLADRVLALAAERGDGPAFGPAREKLLELVA